MTDEPHADHHESDGGSDLDDDEDTEPAGRHGAISLVRAGKTAPLRPPVRRHLLHATLHRLV
jgi:hypothetical protein